MRSTLNCLVVEMCYTLALPKTKVELILLYTQYNTCIFAYDFRGYTKYQVQLVMKCEYIIQIPHLFVSGTQSCKCCLQLSPPVHSPPHLIAFEFENISRSYPSDVCQGCVPRRKLGIC